MYIELISNINKVKADAIVQVEENSGYADANFVLDFEKALYEVIEEAEQNKFRSIAIPMTSNTYPIHDDTVSGLFAQVINEDAADIMLNLLLKPDDNCLSKIVLIVDDKMEKSIRRKLALKRRWSKARKLAFVLDALELDLDRKDVCKRHFIDKSDYIRYLKEFSKECLPELIKRKSNITLMNYGMHQSKIQEIRDKLSELNALISDVGHTKYIEYMVAENYIDQSVISKFIEPLDNIIEDSDPLFLYIKHLVPDEKWEKRRKSIRRKKRKDLETIEEDKDKIKEGYNSLYNIIKKTRELIDTAFPVYLLKRFWNVQIWEKIMSDENTSQIAIELLAQNRNASIDSIKKAIHKK